MKGIKMSDCKFYVDETARKVICVIPNTKYMLQEYITEHFSWKDLDISFAIDYGVLGESLKMPSSFRGIAVCNPEDEWNPELGRLIAFNKAKDKCYKSFFKRANMLVQAIDRRLGDMINNFNDFGMKLSEKRDQITDEIDSMMNKEE